MPINTLKGKVSPNDANIAKAMLASGVAARMTTVAELLRVLKSDGELG